MAAWMVAAFVLGALVGAGSVMAGLLMAQRIGTGAVDDMVRVMMPPHEESRPEPSNEQMAAMLQVGPDDVPLDWTDTEPSAAWLSVDERPLVGSLAPGQPIPGIDRAADEAWRSQWEQDAYGMGEVAFEEYVGEHLGHEAAFGADEMLMADDDRGDGWVQPRSFP